MKRKTWLKALLLYKVAIHLSMTGTHSGSGAFFGIPPSGKHFAVQQMRLVGFANGQMTDIWAVIDMMSWMQQLGGKQKA